MPRKPVHVENTVGIQNSYDRAKKKYINADSIQKRKRFSIHRNSDVFKFDQSDLVYVHNRIQYTHGIKRAEEKKG